MLTRQFFSSIKVLTRERHKLWQKQGLQATAIATTTTKPNTKTEHIETATTTPDAATVSKPTEALSIVKWDVTVDQAAVILPKVTSPILPWSLMSGGMKFTAPIAFGVMYGLDMFHTVLPYWGSIAVMTLVLRGLIFPLYIKQHRVSVTCNNLAPKIQTLQMKIDEANAYEDHAEMQINRAKLKKIEHENNIRIKDKFLPPIVQAPLFIAMFTTLRRLAELPVEGLDKGGLLWFVDLTVPDPFYVLPIITSMTLLATIELGLLTSSNPNNVMPLARWFMRALPFPVFWFIKDFPAAVCLFWTVTNFITLLQNVAFKSDKVRKMCNIPEMIVHEPSTLPFRAMTFKSQVGSAMKKAQNVRTTSDLRRLDDIEFRKAGTAPLKKTFSHKPTD